MTICEDLLWQYPTVDLVTANKIDTMIFPTEWWDEYPHQLPHVAQASWAKTLQVHKAKFFLCKYTNVRAKLQRNLGQRLSYELSTY